MYIMAKCINVICTVNSLHCVKNAEMGVVVDCGGSAVVIVVVVVVVVLIVFFVWGGGWYWGHAIAAVVELGWQRKCFRNFAKCEIFNYMDLSI